MKKALVIMVALAVGGVAFASSLSVPWFVDTAPTGAKFPPKVSGVTALIYLHNNKASVVTCSIGYYTAAGTSIGPAAPNNTFVIQPNASLAFRPVVSDPATVGGGQENTAAGWLVPDRPMGTAGGNDNKPNGSLVITWLGEGTDVQGMFLSEGHVVQSDSTVGKIISYAHLLPPGA